MFAHAYAAKLAIKAALPGAFITCTCGCGGRYRRYTLANHIGQTEAQIIIAGLDASAEAAREYLRKLDLR